MSNINFSDLGEILEKTLKGKEFSYKTKYGGEVRDTVNSVFIINSISWGDEVPRKPVQTPKGIINLPTELDNKWDKPEIRVKSERGFVYEFERCRFR